jgi:hypothetical protein
MRVVPFYGWPGKREPCAQISDEFGATFLIQVNGTVHRNQFRRNFFL